ncbi:MAG TPA: SLC13 family permease [Alphaproteobacteria bacterium]|nr:SLC13 family permease [Alphaproteobacteria bacterium]USO06086.1 MAG: SLC13 family permease [Rhodospirillales bacterium]HOO82654.1 SLC13 family permease [Alphaproteobacteria bacterium]
MNILVDPTIHMWFGLFITVAAVVSFMREKVSIEITSLAVLTALLVFGQVFPLPDAAGKNQIDSTALLSGFANPSLIAVLALLVMGQGMIQTDSLRILTSMFARSGAKGGWLTIFALMVFVCVMSAFMNNTPLVIIAIPIVQVLAHYVGLSESRILIPLSYIAILGGMTTLIGSSTNLLVSSAMEDLGYSPLGFFEFVVPGAMLAVVGFVYVFFLLPRFLPDRANMVRDLAGSKKEFVAEIDVAEDSKLIGTQCVEGRFPGLPDLNIKLIQRGGHLILPPFEGYAIESGDILIISSTRDSLTALLAQHPAFLLSEEQAQVMQKTAAQDIVEGDEGGSTGNEVEALETRVLAEVMITPASRLIDMSLEHANFQRQFGVVVLGIQRRAKVVRRRLGRIRLESGDVLLVAGPHSTVNAMRESTDFIVLSGSKRDLPVLGKTPIAAGIFISAIGLAAAGLISIPVAAIAGAAGMIATGCLNIRQATRAIDRKIFLLVGSMLALGVILESSGAARSIAEGLLTLPFVDTPLSVLAVLFILVAIATNVLSNNACAILFTPIAMNLAGSIDVPPGLNFDISHLFAVTVIFAANCSFASPIGYQTNLLVMGPGHYRFRDFARAGIPLVLLLWGAYIFIVQYYYGL